MGTQFTDEQKLAIQTTDKSVLVSAAAGSGKTAVLVERIIGIILDGKADVDELLVVTFTNAAASEMRLRLAKAIRQRMASHPEDAPRLSAQLSKLYKAYITTMNSFSLRVIREFFHELDIDPGFGTADEAQSELLQREAVTELFEDAFVDDDLIEGGSFRSFLRLYSEERTEESFKDNMLKAYGKLRSMPDYFEWAYESADILKVTPDTFQGSALQKLMSDDCLETIQKVQGALNKLQSMFEEVGLSEIYQSKLLPQAEAAEDILTKLSSTGLDDSVISALDNFPKATISVKAADKKESYELIKAEVKRIRENVIRDGIGDFKKRYIVPDLATRLSEMNESYEYTIYYLKLLEEFERRYKEKKKEHGLMDFSDQEHYAAEILKNKEARDILRKRFKYIFVDEYQDTNNIQERLISSVARPDNVFRVGDIKQSIYKFRQAAPEIFEGLYKRFSEGDDENEFAIVLGKNFRTNDRTIRYINYVFERIMEGYDERAMLYTGVECDEQYDFIPEVHILLEENETEPEAGAADDPADIDDDGEDLSKEEAEARYIAKICASIIGTEFYDTKAGVVRKAKASDIAILFRAVKYRGETMSNALRDLGIEPHVADNEDYFDTVEIGVAVSLLSVIDNMRRDVPLIAVLHSEIFSFDPEELANIRLGFGDRRKAFFEAFEWYAANGQDEALRDKAAAALQSLLEWRELSRMMPLADFVWKVLVDSGYYSMAGAMPGGAMRQANLRSLADRAADFSKDRVATLSSFIGFIEILKSKKLSNGQTPTAGTDDNVVRISTIHKSKGLEFPFVIVGGLGHKFKFDSNEKGFSFDSGVGVGMPYIDPARRYWRSTPVQRAINNKSKRDSYREELRLLYVAMTRARNKLYLVGSIKKEEELTRYEANPICFLKAMGNTLKSPFNKYYISPLDLTAASGDQKKSTRIKEYASKPLTAEEQKLYDEIDRRFKYRYPYEDLLDAKAKYSVSAIRREELEAAEAAAASDIPGEADGTEVTARQKDEEVVSLWRNAQIKKKAGAADIGTAYHRIMEFVDFSKVTDADGNIDEAYIAERAEFLRAHDAIDEAVYNSLDLTQIAAFFASDLGQRAIAADSAGKLRREKPFTLKTNRNGKDIMVQGVIDCCFEENGKMVLIDYKSSFIHPGKPLESEMQRIREEYKVQIELYSEALCKGTGKEVSEAYLYLFTVSEAVNML